MIPDTQNRITCPYPGLRPFRPDESLVFFGRDQQVDQLLSRLGSQRFLAIVGPSGCGKSSLVRAGLIPALDTGLMASAGARWAVATMRPGRQPLRRLAEALLDDRVLGDRWSAVVSAAALLHSALRRGPLSLAELAAESPPPGERKLLLLVDQFEEVFRYRRDGDRDEADTFVALLLASARQREVPIYVILTMRSDYIGESAVFEGLPEALNESLYLTPRLTREQRHEAIEYPAHVFDGRVEPDLVARLLNDMGSGPDRLPLMQHALMRMWKGARPSQSADGEFVLTLAVYQAIGGIDGALSGQADAAFLSLDEEQRRIAGVLFRALCERTSVGSDIRRPAPLEAVTQVAGAPVEAVVAVLDVFRHPDLCFLTPPWPEPVGAETWLDISHESLIRQWDRLRGWVEDEADSAEVYRRLHQWAARWSEGQAGLWGTPDLELALDWKDRARPSPAWASRYGGDFDLAMRFLDSSKARRDADRDAERQAQRQRTAEKEARLLVEEELKRRKDQEEADRRLARESEARAREQAQAVIRQRRLLRYLLAATILALVLSLATGIAYRKARRSAELASVLQLSAQSRAVKPRRPQLALLLAAESYRKARELHANLIEPEQALRDVLATVGGQPLTLGQSDIRALAFAPDGRLATAGNDGVVQLWDFDRLEVPDSVLQGDRAPISVLAFAEDGRLAAAGTDKTVQVWHSCRPNEPPLPLKHHQQTVRALAFAPNGLLATAGDDNTICLWSTDRPEQPANILHVTDTIIFALAFLRDGRLASAGTDKTVRLWDLHERNPSPKELIGHSECIRALASDGQRLASAGEDGTVRVWNIDRREAPATVLDVTDKKILALAFAPDGRLASAGTESTVRVWDLTKKNALTVLAGHENDIVSMSFAPDGRLATATGKRNDAVRLWDLSQPVGQPMILRGHKDRVLALGVAPDGRVVSAGDDRTVRLWNPRQPKQTPIVLPGINDDILALALAPNGRSAVASYADKTVLTVLVWDLDQPRATPTKLQGVQAPIQALAFAPDGRLATAEDSTIRLWDLDKPGMPRSVLGKHEKTVRALAIAPDCHRLASGGDDKEVRVWNLDRPGKPDLILKEHKNKIKALAFAGNDRLASTDSDGVGRLWNLGKTGKSILGTEKMAHPDFLIKALASAHGQGLAIAGSDGAALLPETSSYRWPPLVLSGADVASITHSEANQWLVAGLNNGNVVLWSLSPEKLIADAHRIAGRDLTDEERELYGERHISWWYR